MLSRILWKINPQAIDSGGIQRQPLHCCSRCLTTRPPTAAFSHWASSVVYWPISPDVIIRKILNAPYWWAISLCVFIYNCMHWVCCALCSEVRVLGDAALKHVNLTAHQHGERGISRHVWHAYKGSIAVMLHQIDSQKKHVLIARPLGIHTRINQWSQDKSLLFFFFLIF